MSVAWQIAFTLLCAIVALLAVLFMAVARHLAALSARLPQPVPLELRDGPPLGTTFGDEEASNLVSTLMKKVPRGGPPPTGLAVLFLSTTCSSCVTLIPAVARFARDHSDILVIVSISGDGDARARFAAALGSVEVHLDDGDALRAFGVATLPYGLFYDDERQLVAKGVVNDRDMLESLLQQRVRKDGDSLLAAFL